MKTSPSHPNSQSRPLSELQPPAHLPRPNPAQVAEFQRLFFNRFGVQLEDEDAQDQARRLVTFVFLMQHALPRLKDFQAKDFQAEQEPSPTETETSNPS